MGERSRTRSRNRSRTRGGATTTGSLTRRLFTGGLIVGAGGLLAGTLPDRRSGTNSTTEQRIDGLLIHRTEAPIEPTGTVETPVRMSQFDVAFMNRLFRERNHEVPFCGLIKNAQLRPWIADTVRADETKVQYTIDNCPTDSKFGELNATLHTHPNGTTTLSKADVEALFESATEMMCVQGGTVSTAVETVTENLKCYRSTNDDDATIEEVPIVVINDPPSSDV